MRYMPNVAARASATGGATAPRCRRAAPAACRVLPAGNGRWGDDEPSAKDWHTVLAAKVPAGGLRLVA